MSMVLMLMDRYGERITSLSSIVKDQDKAVPSEFPREHEWIKLSTSGLVPEFYRYIFEAQSKELFEKH